MLPPVMTFVSLDGSCPLISLTGRATVTLTRKVGSLRIFDVLYTTSTHHFVQHHSVPMSNLIQTNHISWTIKPGLLERRLTQLDTNHSSFTCEPAVRIDRSRREGKDPLKRPSTIREACLQRLVVWPSSPLIFLSQQLLLSSWPA